MADFYLQGLGAPLPFSQQSTLAFVTFALNANNDAMEFIVQSETTDPITTMLVRQGTITGTAPTYRFSLQGVTNGRADGTIKGGGTVTVTSQPTSGNNNSIIALTFGASYTPTQGEWLALVIDYASGTIDGSNNVTFTSSLAGISARESAPTVWHVDGGVGTRQTPVPIYGYRTASRAYGNPITAIQATTINDAANPDEYALQFTIPTTWWSTFEVLGLRINLTSAAAATDTVITIYDTDGTTVLQQTTIDSDHLRAATADSIARLIFDDTPASLATGSTYYASLKGGAGQTVNMALRVYQVATAADWDAFAGGQQYALATKNNGGAFTPDTTKRPMIELLVRAIVAPSGASGGGPLIGGRLVA